MKRRSLLASALGLLGIGKVAAKSKPNPAYKICVFDRPVDLKIATKPLHDDWGYVILHRKNGDVTTVDLHKGKWEWRNEMTKSSGGGYFRRKLSSE